ncbi:MAG TPA: hypothetical protein VFQ79_08815 [Bryobacteraceae bacterium]|nr:hypothetical protein [Bryobacteraceae bacterium]
MGRLFGLFLLVSVSYGQYANLRTTDDGAILYFSSSLAMRGTSQFDHPKLFAIDSGGLRLEAQRELQGPAVGTPYGLTNYYRLNSVEVSGDGMVRAIVSGRVCSYGGSSCFGIPPKIQTEITGIPGKAAVTLTGQARLSRNGRYAVVCCDGSMVSQARLVDLYTGEEVVLERDSYLGFYTSQPAGRMVTPDGRAVFRGGGGIVLGGLAGSEAIITSESPGQIFVDDSGLFAAYDTHTPLVTITRNRLWRVDLGTGKETRLAEGLNLRLAGMSNDGLLVLFLMDIGGTPQLFVSNERGEIRQLTTDTAGIPETVLSGDGTVVYAGTYSGRLLRIDVETGLTRELVGRAVVLDDPSLSSSSASIAGSAYCVSGFGLADTASFTFPPLPRKWNGLEILLDGEPVPLQSVTPTQACFQIPWDTGVGDHKFSVSTEISSAFESVVEGTLRLYHEVMPYFVFSGDTGSQTFRQFAAAGHEDFRGRVTPHDPARPGEIVHFYMTGLGPVIPAIGNGIAGPANPPSRTQAQLSCRMVGSPAEPTPAEVLFSGLAPGFVGYYQVSIRLPSQFPFSDFGQGEVNATIACSVDGIRSAAVAAIPVKPDAI